MTAILEDPGRLVERALGLLSTNGRRLLGIAGSPGAGKSTLAGNLVQRVNSAAGPGTAVVLPMDGFHLANRTLDRLGRRDRKGALDTFDGWGLVALLRRLRSEIDHDVFGPSFRRSVDEPIAGEIVVPAGTRLVVAEGNYLLVESTPWGRIRSLLDESWFCVSPASTRQSRLVERHIRHGRSVQAAATWAREVDARNAELIETTRSRADVLVSGRVRF
ncbi:MAG: nucleoside/nucleotide kinase family protein [Microlunatus sp.]|nr:nucleoside/nucleotide kinase family protein [Microlunatus sp.]